MTELELDRIAQKLEINHSIMPDYVIPSVERILAQKLSGLIEPLVAIAIKQNGKISDEGKEFLMFATVDVGSSAPLSLIKFMPHLIEMIEAEAIYYIDQYQIAKEIVDRNKKGIRKSL